MRGKVEKKAYDLLNSLGLAGQIPIDPKMVAEALQIDLEEADFSDELSGALLRKPGQVPLILINKNDPPNRKRFSIAHEVAHFCLGHTGEYFVDSFALNKRDVRSSYAIDRSEIEANAFAAALLMPEDLLFSEALSLLSGMGQRDQGELIRLLAKRFAVSPSAMGYRLVNLGLITAVGDD